MAFSPTYTNDGGRTVNGISITNPKTGDAYLDKLRQATVNASQRSANDRGGMNGMFNPGTTYGRNAVGEVVNAPGTYGQGAQRVEAWRNANTPKANDTPYYGGGGGGGGGYSLPEIEQPDYSAWFNTLTDIYNKLYDTQKNAIKEAQQRADNKANMAWAKNLRDWKKMYADQRNGQGLTNRLNINYNRDNQIEENQTTADTNLLNALSGRYTNLAGLTSQLPNMDNNTIKKIMSQVGSISI